MKFIAEFITRKKRGGTAVKEEPFDADVIEIGRGTGSDINLPDPRILLEHARISERANGWYIEALSGATVSVNNNLVQTSQIKPGDVVKLGPYEATIKDGPEDVELVFGIELVDPLGDELEELVARSEINLADIGLSKRAWSWILFCVLFVGIFVGPLLTSMFVSTHTDDIMTTSRGNIQASPTAIWVTGGISSSHKFFGEDCEACHTTPFVQVQDTACLTCHEHIEHHADPVRFEYASFADTSCQSCHKEHQGDVSMARNDQKFCTDCHSDLAADAPNSTLSNASDFGENHPEFRPTVVIDTSADEWSRAVLLLNDPPPAEHSSLTFPHADHLRSTGVQHPVDGNIRLECADCHTLDDGGVSMLPITFESHCHECHILNFDTQLSDRELLHGRPDDLMQQVSDIYDAVAMRGGYEEPAAPAIIRRRPGEPLTEPQKAEALDWAQAKAAEVLDGRFGRGLCDECHVVTDDPGAPRPWVIQPVMLSTNWFPKARFDHVSHTGVDCGTCHAADTSALSSDVLMPSVAVCQSCHGGEAADNRVPSTCIDCHDFHNDNLPPLRQVVETRPQHRQFAVLTQDRIDAFAKRAD